MTSGTIKSGDQDALSSALTSIDASLSASRGSSSGTSNRTDPSGIRTKISSLIDQQVSSGSLTDDQATELKQLFNNAAPKDGSGGPGGPPPGPPPSGDASDPSSGSATSSTSSLSDTLAAFLKQLQSSQATGYGQDGTTTSSASSSLLFATTA